MPPAIITPMLIGAAVGAVSAAIQGGNILKGALFGALGGAIGGAITSAFGAAGGATSGALGGEAAGAIGGEAAGAAGGMLGPHPGTFGFVDSGAFSGAGGGGAAGGAVSMPPMPDMDVGGAVPPGNSGIAAPVDTSMAQASSPRGYGDTGTADVNALDVRLARGPTETGLQEHMMSGGGSSTGPTSYLESIFKGGQSLLNSRFGTEMAGKVFSGWAAGKNQEEMLKWKQQQIEEGRRNARYGDMGSRYNTAGLMGPNTYYKA